MAKVSDKTYSELADERLYAAKMYRKFMNNAGADRGALLKLARREEQRAASYHAAAMQIE